MSRSRVQDRRTFDAIKDGMQAVHNAGSIKRMGQCSGVYLPLLPFWRCCCYNRLRLGSAEP